MPRFIGLIAAVALTITVIAAWAKAPIGTGSTLKTLGPAVNETQIDPTELTKNTRDLPAQQYDAF